MDDIVVEFGNALHQPIVDRFLGGEDVAWADLRRAWQETVGGACSGVFDSPVYDRFFGGVRMACDTLGPGTYRLLLGDPPFDPRSDGPGLHRTMGLRDAHFAMLVERELLNRERRALLLAGGGHFSLASRICTMATSCSDPHSCAVVLPHYVFADVAERRGSELARLERRLADWPVPSIARIHRTWLADVDARLVLGETAMLIDSDGREVEVPAPLLDAQGRLLSSVGLGDVADAYLYLGPVHSLTLGRPRRRTTDQ